jgi:hypothetical protein
MRLSPPEIWIVHRPDVEREEFDPAELALIDSGEKHVYDIAIIAPRTDENRDHPDRWTILDICGNYFGGPGCDNVYSTPATIPDEYVRYYAADMWTSAFNVGVSQIVHHAGRNLWVTHIDLVDTVETWAGITGYATGRLICRDIADPSGHVLLPVEDARPVGELTA